MIVDVSVKFCHTDEYSLEAVKQYANREYAEHEYDGMNKSAYTELVALAYIYALYYRDDDSVTLDALIADAEGDVEESAPETLLIHVDEDYVPYWDEQIDFNNADNVCCICGQHYHGNGNSPYPIDQNPSALCCDKCVIRYVIPALS